MSTVSREREARWTEDRRLFDRYLRTGDPNVRETIVRRFLPLVRRMARRYGYTNEPFDDLMQVASIGLLKAIERFDLDREIAFSSFAIPTISGELKRHLRDRTWSVRVPRGAQERARRIGCSQMHASRLIRGAIARLATVHQSRAKRPIEG